ncbi:MAG: ATP-binding cassette domain-containing protein [Anaerolineae bacterium]|jgi:ABC-type lipoprotein export system ATPase subunit
MFRLRPKRNGSDNGSPAALEAAGAQNGGNGHHRNGSQSLIECRQLVKTYQSTAGDFPALKEIDLHVGQGEFVAVIGKSGSGKSTLVNMITGIDRPTSGEVLVGGTSVGVLSEGKLAQWRGRNIGVIFQFFQLLPTLTVVENVMLPMDFCHMYSGRERRDRAMHLLEQVDVAEHAHKLPSAVSGGQQQRVAIARALANDPPILAADEPTGNLDSKTAESVFRLFERQVKEGKTILMVTHDRDLAKRATRTIMLADGEIIEEYLVQTFPALAEQQLIRATRQLEREAFPPGATILQEGGAADRFYIVTRGQIEVLVEASDGERLVVARMGRGQYFGETELLRGGANMATVRADPDAGVEVVALGQEIFGGLMAESQASREALDQVARARMAENSNGRNGAKDA